MGLPSDSIKISQLGLLTSSTPSDVLPIVSGGITKKVTPAALSTDYKNLAVVPNSITYLGQNSYELTFPSVDYSSILSPGMRIVTQRNVAAEVQSTALNGTNQYWLRATPDKMAFTDDFVISAWIKVTSYQPFAVIAGRFNGSSGWRLAIDGSGYISLLGFNSGGANFSGVYSLQSIPLNRWVHVTAQLDMSAFTASSTTSYIMFDGVEIPPSINRGGTNPTSLVQAGDFSVGAYNAGTSPFAGKIAQLAVFSSKVTQATIRSYISQGLSGTEVGLASAYSFSGVANDLNTTTPNNLTAQNASGYIADSPFGGQASGLISSTLDYGIIQSISSSTDTTIVVQVPEGNTIPTTGGLFRIGYATVKAPYGFPTSMAKWTLYALYKIGALVSTTSTVYTNLAGIKIFVPVGSWKIDFEAVGFAGVSATAAAGSYALSTSPTALDGFAQVMKVGNDNAGASVRSNISLSRNTDLLVPATHFMITLTSSAAGLIGYDAETATLAALNGYL